MLLKKINQYFLTAVKLPIGKDFFDKVAAIIIPILIGTFGIKAYKIIFALWPVTRTTLGWEQPTLLGGIIGVALISPLGFLVASFFGTYLFLWRRYVDRRYFRFLLLLLFPLISLPLAKIAWTRLTKESQIGIDSSWIHQVIHVYDDALSSIQFLFSMCFALIFFFCSDTRSFLSLSLR